MTALPNIPRLYTALAECLAVGIYALPLGLRFGKTATIASSAAWALALSAFLQATGSVPLAWWIPCMAAAVGIQYLYLWVTRTISLLEAGYVCARAFVLAELAASAEWQLHCFLWPQRSGADGLSLLLLVVVYGGVFGCIWVLEHKHKSPKGHIVISGKAALVAVVMAAMVFAVSNLLFLGDREVDMSVYYIRTLVEAGDVERAALFLGHRHCLTQTVVHGHRLGRTLGIPTVNLTFPPHVLAPRRGVYITRVYLPDGTSLAGVTNVGTRPTVSEGTAVSVETFLLDFDGDLYGKRIRVEFCQRLRDEQKFDSLEALKAQIRENIRQTRDYFAAESTRG